MKIISKTELDQLALIKKRGQHPQNPVVTEVMKLKIGEYLLVEKKEWKLKNNIHQGIRDNSPARKARAKFSVITLANEMGWVIKRIA